MKAWPATATVRAAFLLLCGLAAHAQETAQPQETAPAQELRSILIEVDGSAPKFDVVYHRAKGNATGAVIGGLIGAGIQAGIESDLDGKKRDEMRPHVSEAIWGDAYVKTLNETLKAKGFEPIWVEGKEKPKDFKADVYVVLYPSSYGFRLVDSTTSLVSAYVEFAAIYSSTPIVQRNKAAKEPFYLAGKRQAAYETLAAETATLNSEVETVLAASARRLANKIIYNVK